MGVGGGSLACCTYCLEQWNGQMDKFFNIQFLRTSPDWVPPVVKLNYLQCSAIINSSRSLVMSFKRYKTHKIGFPQWTYFNDPTVFVTHWAFSVLECPKLGSHRFYLYMMWISSSAIRVIVVSFTHTHHYPFGFCKRCDTMWQPASAPPSDSYQWLTSPDR